ncbi:hypothetical protein [Halobacillus litoralis]|uniref:DNA-binding domain-containing protein n=1 Tax=Halobacillus litoralis TaxID=45668 RepID=A0A410MJ71_9BACI|nr:hypothetical protein [Halobacillus litoralis]QAS54740.1 hypothetical protein HLI_21010 [Halobacillus litoralis]
MTVINLQKFITDYVRNPKVRRFPIESIESYKFELNEKKLLKELDFNILNKLAINLQNKRSKRLEQQFPEFVMGLKHHNCYAEYIENYLSKFTEAYLTPQYEMENFMEFSVNYIKENSLPEYFIDMANYCYFLSKTMIEEFDSVANERDVDRHIPLMINRPFNIVNLDYDIDSVLEMVEGERDEPIARKHIILVQKDFFEPEDLIINEVDEQILSMLRSNYSLNDILANFKNPAYSQLEVKEYLTELYKSNLISYKEK